MKKKNVLVFFLKSLLKSVLVLVSILLVGVISYKVSFEVLSKKMETGDVSSGEIQDILDEAQTDEISKNLIYVVDDKKNITHMMVEICNTKTHNMDYVTIPVTTSYTIPAKMYHKMCVVDEEIPQIVKVSKLRNYFADLDDEKGYGYAELIIEKMIGTSISYYTVLPESTFDSHYQETSMTTSYKRAASSAGDTSSTTVAKGTTGSVTMDVAVASDSYVNQLKDLGGDRNKIVDFIKAQYQKDSGMLSNLTVYNKIGYVEAYEKMNVEYYHYWGMPGEYNAKQFTVDTASAKKFMSKLEKNTETYQEVQDFSKSTKSTKTISSTGKKILVLNGSQISGLAATTQTKLVNAGFTVPKVGDYKSETLTQTRIIVTKEGMGQDLASYFKNPEIVVGTVQSGYDIEIILGTVDAN